MRTYNNKLSERVNAQLNRRERTVRLQKRLLAITGIILVSIIILLGTSIRAFASSQNEKKPVYKYYTSVLVENGDTLWTLADEYMQGSNLDKKDYIKEIKNLNQLQNDEIHAGEYIVLAYYTTEKQ